MSLNFKNIVLLFQDNNFVKALNVLNQYSNENKNNFLFYFYRGIANFKLNKFEEAKLIGDKTCEHVSDKFFYSKFIENSLKKNNYFND